jgi:hypothetical protein
VTAAPEVWLMAFQVPDTVANPADDLDKALRSGDIAAS